MDLVIENKADEDIVAWLRVIKLSENKEAARSATAWIKNKNYNGEFVSVQDVLKFLEEYHTALAEENYRDGGHNENLR